MGQDPDCVAKRFEGAVAACWYKPRFILRGVRAGAARTSDHQTGRDGWTANAATRLLGSYCERESDCERKSEASLLKTHG